MLCAAFKLALWKIEGLMTSMLSLMVPTLSAGPHHGQPSHGDVGGHPGAVSAT